MGKKVTLAIPDEMYRRAQRIAELREKRIADVLLESIVLVETREPAVDEDIIVDREEVAFKRMHPVLREKYPGQYVAIYQEELIDHDVDQVALYLRVKEQYPGQFVWIAPVNDEPEETYVVHSPRFVGR